MNIINVEHLYKIYGEKIIFDDASFGIQKGDKIGIVGINGTGKSTLLKMIAGETKWTEACLCAAKSGFFRRQYDSVICIKKRGRELESRK